MKLLAGRRAMTVLSLTAGVLAVATAVFTAVQGEWATAVWALSTALWITVSFIHRCPAPDPDRGTVLVSLEGGPLDGLHVHVQPPRDLAGRVLRIDDHTYAIACVDHTEFTAHHRMEPRP